MGEIKKILVANRGEIAVRIMRTARKMGIPSVAVYSAIDHDSLHVREAGEAVCIGDVELSETYLNIAKIIAAAKNTGCDAIHPGYGFLAENPTFVEACDAAGIIFIGPRSDVMRIMGNKISAREFVNKTGVPVTQGLTGNNKTLLNAKKHIGFPVLLKAAAGGGGKGMVIVHDEKELEAAIESTARQAMAYFGDDTIYMEKYLDDPRHIEFQILGDNHGNVIHLFERECSIQRRYQKIIEESPSPTLTPELRNKMGEAAVKIGKEIGYNNAGTIEFLVDKALNFYFLEMNTRIQVEHPVTEMVTGIDIVEEQIMIASGHPLRLKQEDLHQEGHAIECRIYAEDPENNFLPSPGKMTLYREPVMEHVRIDKGIAPDTEIKSSFDPMIGKLIAWGHDREEAGTRMLSALNAYTVHGIKTNINYLSLLLKNESFRSNSISTKFCDAHTPAIIREILEEKKQIPVHLPVIAYLLYSLTPNQEPGVAYDKPANIWDQTGYWREQMVLVIKTGELEHRVGIPVLQPDHSEFEISGLRYRVRNVVRDHARIEFSLDDELHTVFVSDDGNNHGFASLKGHIFELSRQDFLPESTSALWFDSPGSHKNEVDAPMPGKVIKILVNEGDDVAKGAVLLILEAMKMENSIIAPCDAHVQKINVRLNDRVEAGKALVIIEKKDESESNQQKI